MFAPSPIFLPFLCFVQQFVKLSSSLFEFFEQQQETLDDIWFLVTGQSNENNKIVNCKIQDDFELYSVN